MTSIVPDTALIITTRAHSLKGCSILGNGGWLPPEEREELDWMTFIKFMGWRPELIGPDDYVSLLIDQLNVKWIILTGDPDHVNSTTLKTILSDVAKNPLLLISQGGIKQGNLAKDVGIHISKKASSGSVIKVKGLGFLSRLKCRNNIALPALEVDLNSVVLASLAGKVLIAAKKLGIGKIVVLSFHPSIARDIDGFFTVLLKNLLIYQSSSPVAWIRWENTVILRMDDPGSSEPIYNSVYGNGKLCELKWEQIGKELTKRNGRMTLGYVSGWVDDGNADKSILEVCNTPTIRVKGKVYPSQSIKYSRQEEDGSYKIYDYQAEFSGIQKLVDKNIIDIAVHGHTHIHPNINAWLEAADRYSNNSWFREFSRSAEEFLKDNNDREHPFWQGLKKVFDCFKEYPTTLISPGEEFTDIVILKAREAKLKIISSYYLAININNQFCWVQHVCAPYLNEADSNWLTSELPVVGYFHDFDLSINGMEWFAHCLDKWEVAGAKKFINFKEVASLLDVYISMQEADDMACINIIKDEYKDGNPVPIGVFVPNKNKTFEVAIPPNEGLNFKIELNNTNR